MNAAFALLFLLGSVTTLRDGVEAIPAGEWRYELFTVGPTLPADLDCVFRVDLPGQARVELVTRENLRALLHHEEYEAIASSISGTLHQEIGVPGTFALVIVNTNKTRAARIDLKVTLDTTGRSLIKAKYLSPERRMTVILASFFGFLLLITVSTRKLLIAMRK